MRKTTILLTTAAAGLAFTSPFVAYLGVGLSDSIALDGVFYSWFLALPGAIVALFQPETVAAAVALAIATYFVQYLVLLALMWAGLPAARLLNVFFGARRHAQH